MKERILDFIEVLRRAGVQPSPAESLDAIAAVTTVGMAPRRVREALAATLIKDHAQRPTFDHEFDRFFAAPNRVAGKGKHTNPSVAGMGSGRGERDGQAPSPRERDPREITGAPRTSAQHDEQKHSADKNESARMARQRTLERTPFREMDAAEQEQCSELAEHLARQLHANFARRVRRAKRGQLDVRTTLRRSISKGGVPIEPAYRRRRPGRLDIVVLCDCSHSVAVASRFLLSLLEPCRQFFRRVHLFAFVDRAVPVSMEKGHLIPHEPLDLYARSDFGNTMVTFLGRFATVLNRNTLLLILGDARNNRRPARADLLGQAAIMVRQVVWMNPEATGHWGAGDSAIESYTAHCGLLLAASTPRTLINALARVRTS